MIMWERFVPPIFCLHCYSRSGKIYKFKYFATSHPIEVWVKFRLPKNSVLTGLHSLSLSKVSFTPEVIILFLFLSCFLISFALKVV